MQFSLTSATANDAAPFCIGFAFRAGDVPAGRTVVSDSASLQVTPQTTWNDGSLKFAVIAGTAKLGAGTPLFVRLNSAATATAAAALTTADLKRTGATADVGCGSFGSVRWAGTDWDAPFQTWVSGPLMSSWVYRKPVGSDPQLVAWLEVRLFASGAVEVLPWIENGYLRVAGPATKSATYSFAFGNQLRFSLPIVLLHHQRTPLINGSALSYWLGSDPGVLPHHDALYLQATNLVPSYRANVSPTAAVVAALPATFAPLQQGSFNYYQDNMPGPGYQEPIGLLPQHDVLYLTTTANVYESVVRNGYSAGRYGLHYRDETTNRPLMFSKYPHLTVEGGASTTSTYTPTSSGVPPPWWEVAHSPSVGYMAYLVTGRWYFMEQCVFAATFDYLGKSDNEVMRNGAANLVQSCVGAWQTRACAWQLRTLVQAIAVLPDADTALRTEFINSMHANIDQYHAQYVAQPSNPWGWVEPGGNYANDSIFAEAPWMQDFVTAAVGYSIALGLPIDATRKAKWDAFFMWKAQSIVKRLGPANGFWYINADPYVQTISAGPTDISAFKTGVGQWLDEAASYAATPLLSSVVSTTFAWWGHTEGVLNGEAMPGDRSMWGNLQPAIAYAVQLGAPGALAAYHRMVGATNWPALRDALDTSPVWSVQPTRSVQV